MRGLDLVLAVVFLGACSSARYGANETGAPSLIFPAHLAEGETGKDGGRSFQQGEARGTPDGGAPEGTTLPDPEPLVTRQQWSYSFEYDRGTVRVTKVEEVVEPKPVATARRVGRFAFELWLGKELVDRVRFDFPMLAADEPDPGTHRPLHTGARFGPGAHTSQRILIPASDRATSARLVDRATGRVTAIPWPPTPAAAPKPTPGPSE